MLLNQFNSLLTLRFCFSGFGRYFFHEFVWLQHPAVVSSIVKNMLQRSTFFSNYFQPVILQFHLIHIGSSIYCLHSIYHFRDFYYPFFPFNTLIFRMKIHSHSVLALYWKRFVPSTTFIIFLQFSWSEHSQVCLTVKFGLTHRNLHL